MKKAIIQSILFLLIFYLISFILNFMIISVLKSINIGDFGVLNKISKGQINTDIIISGSSRAYVHYNPEIITQKTNLSCFNIGTNGSELDHQIPKLKFYLNNNKAPKILIQDISIHSLNNFKSKVYDPYKYLPYINDKDLYKGFLNIDKYFWVHKYFPITNFIYYNTNFQRHIIREFVLSMKNGKDNLINGFLPQNLSWSETSDTFLKEMTGIKYSIRDENIQLLKEEIELCKKNNIKLIFVISPLYFESLQKVENSTEIINTIKNVSESNQIIFINYLNSDVNYKKENFYNNMHLNNNGVTIFNYSLCDDLKKIIE